MLRPFIIVAAVLSSLGAHCSRPPGPVPQSQIYFDSGAVVRLHLKDGLDIRGTLVNRVAPGGSVLMLCEAQDEGECPAGERDRARSAVSAVTQLRYRLRDSCKRGRGERPEQSSTSSQEKGRARRTGQFCAPRCAPY
jgi:hypothetical protein